MNIWIAGTGSALPEKIVTNDDLSRTLETSDEWIYSRTGIHERHICEGDESFATLGRTAAEKALDAAGVAASSLDLIVAATATAGNVTPSSACRVQEGIGAGNAYCFDLNAACSGFLYALHTAEALMEADGLQNALVLGGDILSHFLDWNDRTTCVLFGDAVGAVVLRASEDAEAGRILGSVLDSDGSMGKVLTCRSDPYDHFIRMNGPEVYRFAVRTVPQVIEKVLEKTGISKDKVSLYVLHQANARIVEAVAKHMGEPLEKFPMNLEHTANTSAATIPVLLDELVRNGSLHRGDIAVLAGFGGGLTWGASVIRY